MESSKEDCKLSLFEDVRKVMLPVLPALTRSGSLFTHKAYHHLEGREEDAPQCQSRRLYNYY